MGIGGHTTRRRRPNGRCDDIPSSDRVRDTAGYGDIVSGIDILLLVVVHSNRTLATHPARMYRTYRHRTNIFANSCAAAKYNLPSLQRLALRKQGLHTGIQCSTILASARFAYAHTPDTESKLRAHYLALIIRCRGTFKRSGTMQLEMEKGGKMFFDLFVAMCNHMVSLARPVGRM